MTTEASSTGTTSSRRRQPFNWELWLSFAVFMMIMIGCTFGYYWYNNFQTYHLAPVQVGVLYRDGNRDMREFKHALKFTQAKTVVSLIDEDELHDPTKPQFGQEGNYCYDNSIQYIRLPVKLGGWPTSEDLKTFIGIVTNPANQPVLVHCAQGVRRTGMFVAAYQESVLHESREQAAAAIKTFGHKDRDLDDVRVFIKDYDPVKETFSGEHANSAE
jgi:protein-tyrosine phosphatase